MPSLGGGGKYGGSDVGGGAGGSHGGGYDSSGDRDYSSSHHNNTAWGVDPITGRTVQVGMPSLSGRGMMTTGVGGQLGFLNTMRSGGNLNEAWKAMTMSNKSSPFHNQYRQNLQKNIRDMAAARKAADFNTYKSIVNSDMGWGLKAEAMNNLESGLLGELDAVGIDTQEMRDTHHGGGFMGQAFGWGAGADDVQTMSETRDGLGTVDPDNPMGYSPLGFMGVTVAPHIGAKLAELTRSPVAGMIGKNVVGTVAENYGPTTPSGSGAISMGAKALGVPMGAQMRQMAGLMNKGANLNYAGHTNKTEGLKNSESSGGSRPWWTV
ncbi:protein of unknown function [Pseudodesulfovibrio profundus]|uniref:Uncharacterized protein n=1 Tax=Pseudodesulfovibrio profundus TaxID=57320 RepID=A0A2C8FDB7_9BACT|nr:hypothetical protein [Pseudodesulfovibrio profundus]SOB60642.1 protein of unknown function [Pseudodesulfovibrio profundus]